MLSRTSLATARGTTSTRSALTAYARANSTDAAKPAEEQETAKPKRSIPRASAFADLLAPSKTSQPSNVIASRAVGLSSLGYDQFDGRARLSSPFTRMTNGPSSQPSSEALVAGLKLQLGPSQGSPRTPSADRHKSRDGAQLFKRPEQPRSQRPSVDKAADTVVSANKFTASRERFNKSAESRERPNKFAESRERFNKAKSLLDRKSTGPKFSPQSLDESASSSVQDRKQAIRVMDRQPTRTTSPQKARRTTTAPPQKAARTTAAPPQKTKAPLTKLPEVLVTSTKVDQASNLPALFTSPANPSSQVIPTTVTSTLKTTRSKRHLEQYAGDYSRYLPSHLTRVFDVGAMGATNHAKLTLARRWDVSLGQRANAINIVSGVAGTGDAQSARVLG